MSEMILLQFDETKTNDSSWLTFLTDFRSAQFVLGMISRLAMVIPDSYDSHSVSNDLFGTYSVWYTVNLLWDSDTS